MELHGLRGIEPVRGNLIRPIIECKRDEIEKYCEIYNLDPKYDKTNNENVYTRNKIRNLLIPYIKENFNPNIVESINRLTSLVRQENNYFEQVVKEEYEKLLLEKNEKNIVLDLKKFNMLKKVIKSRIILYTINELLGNCQGIEKVNVEDVRYDVKVANNDMGRVIGKQGRVAKAIRTLMRSLGAKEKKKITIEFID